MITPSGVPNYFYMESTGGSNLRKHLYKRHPEEYDNACAEHGWLNRRLLQTEDASIQTRGARPNIPPFSESAFMDHLVRFIVSDDQVTFTPLS
jgi:hypothetical protein